MQKNVITVLLMFAICLSAAGCAGGSSAAGTDSSSLEEAISVDMDLTVLSSTMLSAEYINIVTNPENYAGKIIKVSGIYTGIYYAPNDRYYHFVITKDGDACCQEGFEFALNGENRFPHDYPKDKAKIEVIGIFSSYDDQGSTNYRLAVDDITFR